MEGGEEKGKERRGKGSGWKGEVHNLRKRPPPVIRWLVTGLINAAILVDSSSGSGSSGSRLLSLSLSLMTDRYFWFMWSLQFDACFYYGYSVL